MTFEAVRGLKGKVYVPAATEGAARRYPCKECYVCQLCSEDRCRVCRDGQKTCQCDKCAQ